MNSAIVIEDFEENQSILIQPAVEISEETREKLLSLICDERQVIIHCKLFNPYPWAYARIWETTYLIDHETDHRSRLLYVDGIPKFPYSTEMAMGATLYFTLIFSALPKFCTTFKFLEQTAGKIGFHVPMIKRNTADVYNIDLSESIV